ncbi:hypothetical protein AMEX_G14577 [Astyanax mexicanus]|uniref:Integrase core domain-containing protein n=1 Tax=Astyanax mexicanus TaxID=7994 RepID=A0A8T2LS28_ASTMX|nr:hypothetical protein AMEX_G14577 [Astyanax mexicanus]
MASRNFLNDCRRTFLECTRVLSSDDQQLDNVQPVITRLETMASSIRWASGRLIEAEVADEMIGLINELIQEASNQHQPSFPGFTVPRRAGHVGRSVCQITQQQLQMLLSFNFSGKQIANILGVSRSTVKRRLRQYNLSFRGRYTTLSDEALDSSVLEIVSANDEIGPEAVRARLAGEGILVQRLRVRQSVIRTNPEGAALRTMSHRLHRRTYKVAGPNSLWHVDGNHKLIRWRIVIHGGVDGYSRLVVFLQASNNNRSDTVMDLFIGAVSQYGVPSRWNHHKLRTAHMSPHQIFVQACLSQHLQHHTGIQGLFGADEQPEAEGGEAGAAAAEGGEAGAAAAEGGEARVPAFDWHQTVDVPVNRFILNGEQLEHIRQNINPLGGARDSLGTDIFEQILNYLS